MRPRWAQYEPSVSQTWAPWKRKGPSSGARLYRRSCFFFTNHICADHMSDALNGMYPWQRPSYLFVHLPKLGPIMDPWGGAKLGPIMGAWGAQAWAHYGPMGGSSLGQSWAHILNMKCFVQNVFLSKCLLFKMLFVFKKQTHVFYFVRCSHVFIYV
jgi:hypothetical protein